MGFFLVCTEHAREGERSVKPTIGTAIAAFGNQVVTTILTTCAVDTYPQDVVVLVFSSTSFGLHAQVGIRWSFLVFLCIYAILIESY